MTCPSFLPCAPRRGIGADGFTSSGRADGIRPYSWLLVSHVGRTRKMAGGM